MAAPVLPPSDAELLALGRAVYDAIKLPGRWPRRLTFELFNHKRGLQLLTEVDGGAIETFVNFPNRIF